MFGLQEHVMQHIYSLYGECILCTIVCIWIMIGLI